MKRELILWGFKAKYGIGAIKLSENISHDTRLHYQNDGWTLAIYEKGFDPKEFKMLAQQEILINEKRLLQA